MKDNGSRKVLDRLLEALGHARKIRVTREPSWDHEDYRGYILHSGRAVVDVQVPTTHEVVLNGVAFPKRYAIDGNTWELRFAAGVVIDCFRAGRITEPVRQLRAEKRKASALEQRIARRVVKLLAEQKGKAA